MGGGSQYATGEWSGERSGERWGSWGELCGAQMFPANGVFLSSDLIMFSLVMVVFKTYAPPDSV